LPFDIAFGLHLKDPTLIRYFERFAGTTVIDLRLILVESVPETKETP
jgi:hypothetical protein